MLDQIISDAEASQRPIPLNRPTVGLTARGHAAVALYRFVRQVRALDAVDRGYVLELLRLELDDAAPTA